jgi:7-keto-8-aminopelargonate synthetase-like enzyme
MLAGGIQDKKLGLAHHAIHLQALILSADLEAWAAGQQPLQHNVSAAVWRQQLPTSMQSWQQRQMLANVPSGAVSSSGALQELTLFSLNDYLGLACHPEVRAAAATAACQVS